RLGRRHRHVRLRRPGRPGAEVDRDDGGARRALPVPGPSGSRNGREGGGSGPVSAASDRSSRLAVWRAYGATPEEASELEAYAASPLGDVLPARAYPLPDPPHVAAWERYAAEASEQGAFATLGRALVQLRFPIQAGISQ